jgi:hypothetical protein
MDRSYREPLINLKVGPKEKEITFLVDSGSARSSFIMTHSPGLSLSLGWLPISGVKGEEFLVPLFEHTLVKFQCQVAWVFLHFVPEAGINLLGRDLLSELSIEIKVRENNFNISLNLMTGKIEVQILPEVY